ncbi:MAG: hypothetical protein AUG49_19275 [Catenulispora sp. 13_1_20CM_3_70_7]|nr:MAG: hypothetical protein AUG49_19275 [Catenulispora sp. 13_1_20CM_3_70_7]
MVDSFLWIVVTWLLVRWIRCRDDRLLLWSGLVTAVALQAKYLIVFFWLAAVAAILVVGPRDLLRRWLFWAGAAVVVLTALPALVWQARHGWPQLAMGQVLAAERDPGGPAGFVLLLLVSAGVLGAPLLGYGLWRTLRSPEYRFLGWTFLGLVVIFLATLGHGYYTAGMFAALCAAGAVGLDRVRGRWLPWVAWPAGVLSAVLVVTLLPVRPATSLAGRTAATNPVNADSVGWPELADAVASAYRALPPDQRRRTTIVAHTYWMAGALARYGPPRGLPEVYSPNRGYWYFGSPPDSATAVVYVGDTSAHLMQYFDQVRQVATVDNRLGVANTVQGAPIWLCDGPRQPWSMAWPRLRFL